MIPAGYMAKRVAARPNWPVSEIETNEHCLLPSLEKAKELLNAGRFEKAEPGPYRIFAVFSVQWP